MRAVLLLLLFAGCDPVWQLRARVRSPDGAPLPHAAVALTCAPAGSDRRGQATRTDAAGEASLGWLGDRLPPDCLVQVARPGYRTYSFSFEQLCGSAGLDDCHRSQHVEVTLQPW